MYYKYYEYQLKLITLCIKLYLKNKIISTTVMSYHGHIFHWPDDLKNSKSNIYIYIYYPTSFLSITGLSPHIRIPCKQTIARGARCVYYIIIEIQGLARTWEMIIRVVSNLGVYVLARSPLRFLKGSTIVSWKVNDNHRHFKSLFWYGSRVAFSRILLCTIRVHSVFK